MKSLDFFASSLDTVSLAPGFGLDWNKRAVRNRDSNHIKIKKVEKEQEVFRASALKTAEKVLQENLHLAQGRSGSDPLLCFFKSSCLSQVRVHFFTGFHTAT